MNYSYSINVVVEVLCKKLQFESFLSIPKVRFERVFRDCCQPVIEVSVNMKIWSLSFWKGLVTYFMLHLHLILSLWVSNKRYRCWKSTFWALKVVCVIVWGISSLCFVLITTKAADRRVVSQSSNVLLKISNIHFCFWLQQMMPFFLWVGV